MYVHGNVVGLYSDGVLPGSIETWALRSEMVSKRLMMASELFGCEYAVAQCMSRSVGLYGRLGFKVTGNLFLYPSLAVRVGYWVFFISGMIADINMQDMENNCLDLYYWGN